VPAYASLSRYYDAGWSAFAGLYVPLVRRILEGREGPARILDLACGTGVLACALAEEGHEVLGVDLSPAMVARARARAVPGVAFQEGDMTAYRPERPFDLVLCTFDSVNYLLDGAAMGDFLRCAAQALLPGGSLAFDANTEVLYREKHAGSLLRRVGDETFRQILSYDPVQAVATTTFEFEDASREVHVQRPWNLADLLPLLSDAELRLASAHCTFDGTPYHTRAERLICLAVREAS
jgi:SAM-dependent methyltransferase